MKQNPTFEQLIMEITHADLQQIKEISKRLAQERTLYTSKDYNDLLVLTSKRLLYLSENIVYKRKANTSN